MTYRRFPDWATLDIPDIGNGDPNKIDPGIPKQAEGWEVEKPLLQHMNWLQNLFGAFIRANNEYKVSGDSHEAGAGEIVVVDNTAGVITTLLPQTPVQGQWVLYLALEKYSNFPVTVSGNGRDIMVVGDQLCTLDIDDVQFVFWWDPRPGANIWRITQMGVTGRIQV